MTAYAPVTVSSPLPTEPPQLQSAEEFMQESTTPHTKRSIIIRVVGADGTKRTQWLASELARRINELLKLPANWDGDAAEPTKDEAVQSAVDVTSRLVDEHSIPPFVIPLVDGGIQLEWHSGAASVEIEIDGRGAPHALVTDEQGTVIENTEFTVVSPPDSVRNALRAITGRLLAAL